MGEIHTPVPVNLIIGMLSRQEGLFVEAEKRLEGDFGAVDLRSEVFPFDFTDYYEEEMGRGIKRQFLSFQRLIEPQDLVSVKQRTNRLEAEFNPPKADRPGRLINLDPGYIAGSKLVLASTKDYSHRVYLGGGIYAEVTLRYSRGGFEPLPWTYPDYKTKGYLDFFSLVRRQYLEKLRRFKLERYSHAENPGNY